MATCDVCNATVSESQGTVYSADEFRSLVRQGYEPPASTQAMMTAMGMSVTQWKSGLVASSATPWLLCPSCAAGARRLIPRAAGAPAGMPLAGRETADLLVQMLTQAQRLGSSGGQAAKPKKRVPCPHCGQTKDENQNPCPHCGFTEWSLIAGFFVVALGCAAAVVFWFENAGWLIGTSAFGALFALLAGVFLIKNLRLRRRDRGQSRYASVPAADTSDDDADEPDEDQEDDEPAPAVRAEPAAPPARRPTWTLEVRRHKRFDCHSKSYEGTKRLAVSPDGRILASAGGSQGGDICLIDLTTAEQVATLEAHTY